MKIEIRKFERADIPRKVEWINNPENNQFLHYDIPICIEKTAKWFDSHIGDENRYDGVIIVDNVPVGTIGLLSIDKKNKKAEFYIAMGEVAYKGKGIAREASKQMLKYGFTVLELNRIYLFTETENIVAQRLFEKIGFVQEGLLRKDIISHNRYVDRFIYGLLKEKWQE